MKLFIAAFVLLHVLTATTGFRRPSVCNNNRDIAMDSWTKQVGRMIASATVALSTIVSVNPAAFAEEWTDRNRLAADAWRAVDEIYYDRTFNGKDWFKLRQELVKKGFKNDEEVYDSIAKMLLNLGDKYTRYLPPAKYDILMNSAQGELTGVGLELLGMDDGTVMVNNIEEESPARQSGIMRGDILRNIDGTSTEGLSPEEVAVIIRGKKVFLSDYYYSSLLTFVCHMIFLMNNTTSNSIIFYHL